METKMYALGILMIFYSCSFLFAQTDFWEQTNGPYGNNIWCLCTHPNGTIFAGTIGNGIFKTIDGSQHWTKASNGLTNDTIITIAIDTDGNIFAGTYRGIFLSTNNGNNWNEVGLRDTIIRSIIVDIKNNIYATSTGVFRSTDTGRSWIQIVPQEYLSTVYSIDIHLNGLIACGTDRGTLISTNNGETWARIDIRENPVYSLAINSLGHIFAMVYNYGIYRSTNNGISWEWKSEGVGTGRVKVLGIDRNDQIYISNFFHWDRYIVRGSRLLRSINNGDSWNAVDTTQIKSFINAMCFDNKGKIYVGTYGNGVYYSSDSGINWFEYNEGIYNTINNLKIDQDDNLYAVSNGAIYRLTNKGASWKQIGPKDAVIKSLAIHPNGNIFVGQYAYNMYLNGGCVYRTTDHGENWLSVGSWNRESVDALAIDKNGIIYAGIRNAQQLFMTTDLGNTWQLCGWIPPESFIKINRIENIEISSNGYIWLSTFENFSQFPLLYDDFRSLYCSIDSGTTWSRKFSSRQNINSILVNNVNDVFIGLDTKGIFKSTDYGNSWNTVNNGLIDTSIKSLSINSQGNIFAGTNNAGIFISTNNGINWTNINSGLTSLGVNTIALDANGYAYIGARNSGVYKSTQPTTEVIVYNKTLPEYYKLFQNYPNPFNPSTTIRYELPMASHVTLKVYNILGQEVATLVNEKKEAGRYEVNFDGSKLPSGVYFYRIQAGAFTQTRKLLLLR
jgi:photosystem II stability/assembly factor-like uncharacterized protein